MGEPSFALLRRGMDHGCYNTEPLRVRHIPATTTPTLNAGHDLRTAPRSLSCAVNSRALLAATRPHGGRGEEKRRALLDIIYHSSPGLGFFFSNRSPPSTPQPIQKLTTPRKHSTPHFYSNSPLPSLGPAEAEPLFTMQRRTSQTFQRIRKLSIDTLDKVM